MQVLKKEVRSAIIKAAVNEFFEKSYHGTSMRAVAQRANISVGNVYRYYKNKQSLFEEIAQPVISELTSLFTIPEENGEPISLDLGLKILKERFVQLLINNRKSILILYDGSERTPYSNFKDEWKNMISVLFSSYIGIYNRKFPNSPFDERISKAGATSFLEGMLEILREFDEPLEINNLALEFIRLYFDWRIAPK
jgi:AcrR family transcriptional regulator